MYGDMTRLRTEAAQLRTVANLMRTRAAELKAQSESMQWESTAATMFRTQIDAAALDLGRCAALVDDAANALVAHAGSVDAVKSAIAEAQRFVEGLVNEARSVVNNVVRTVGAVGEAVVNLLFGHEIPDWKVNQAERLLTVVPITPPAGSRDWLDAKSRVHGHGW